MPGNTNFFQGRLVALLTKHEKERVIKPVFEKATGSYVLVKKDFDTDQLGTFTREVTRTGTQLETARVKAKKGMELLGTDLGLASEGSFEPHPLLSFLPWNIEIVLLVDSLKNIEICGETANSNTNYDHLVTSDYRETEEFARKIGFPEHWLVIYPDNNKHQAIKKGINTWERLKDKFTWATKSSPTRKVFLETDMRAHANPTRMLNIQKATEDLIRKLNQSCPKCNTPGFSIVEKEKGLPCEWCGRPTKSIKAVVFTCKKCGFNKKESFPKTKKAPAGSCQYCNP